MIAKSRHAVFLDTVGLIAIWNRTDQWHQVAIDAFAALASQRTTFVTSTLVLIECGNQAANRPYRHRVVELRKELLAADRLLEPEPQQIADAWLAYERGDNAQAGIVDQISFLVMRELGVQRAFTNDEHFRAAGFERIF